MMMILPLLGWVFRVIALLFLDVFTTAFSWLICLFVTHAEESSVTGFPSEFPGKMREFLVRPLRWFQTTDAALDEYWYGDYPSWFKSKFNQAYYESHWWLRYVMRVIWVVRNPAYGFGTALGYDATGLTVTSSRDEEHLWKSGLPCSSLWVFTNTAGTVGWCYRAQHYYWGDRCVEMYWGYKLPGDTICGRKLVAMQCTPFRQYSQK